MMIHIAKVGCCTGCQYCYGERLNCHVTPCECPVGAGDTEPLTGMLLNEYKHFNNSGVGDYELLLTAAESIRKMQDEIEHLTKCFEAAKKVSALVSEDRNRWRAIADDLNRVLSPLDCLCFALDFEFTDCTCGVMDAIANYEEAVKNDGGF